MEKHLIKEEESRKMHIKWLLTRRITTPSLRYEERRVRNLILKGHTELLTDMVNHRGTSI